MKIYLVGTGMGDNDSITLKAKEIIDNADIIIGAKRLTENVPKYKTLFNSYKSEEIAKYLSDKNVDSVAILLSGDVGFYSGAKRLIEVLSDYDIELIPGISSVLYFCARLKTSWDDVKLLSLHGKRQNIIQYIKRYKKVFAILSGNDSIKELCEKLCYYNMGDTLLHIGQRLSYNDESIITIRAEDIKEFKFDKLSVVLAENMKAENVSMGCISDDKFVRGNVPMTKSEVRALSIAKLELKENSVLFDVGAGTGSISIESGMKLIDGEVYAIDYDSEAIELINKNKQKFAADNVKIIKGRAPQAMNGLPAPTHIFIGGSSGNMSEIINWGITKNPDVKIVVNVIALNTLSEVINIINCNNIKAEIISINIAKDKILGNYRLMMGQNPVYIITIN
ncbi:MAG: precorrin-6y C5,15-methyltransferase (decarboxylating) subunit CbiE [Clostridia bacterium]|nr:precorrin-6y C5,15-methyltransferase (decarboxylating) subunit CbiE [Clostridia bacterium]